nr:DUF3137 domain-containing protein [Candidatus Paceibacterota bacterium]
VGNIEAEYISYRRKQRLVALSLFMILIIPSIFFFVFGSLLSNSVSIWSGVIGTLIFAASIGVFIYFGAVAFMRGAQVVKAFHGQIDKVLFQKIFELLGVTGSLIEHTTSISERTFPDTKFGRIRALFHKYRQLTEPSIEAKGMLDVLRASELITEPFNTTKVDNLFRIKASEGDRELVAGELDIRNITGSGKNRHEKHIFKGYFISYELPHTLDGKTFVSTEGDESGFGHKQFWLHSEALLPSETILEWAEFENLLHVMTTDKIEARYILTPNFMSDLYDWWKDKKRNTRISFIKDRMYLLFPDNQIRLNDSVANIDEEEVKQYMLTIARPLLHVLHLIEDVRMS